ncbi:MAG: hypothetical protein Q9181_005541, partial [Wetmoreana brouardii]
MIGSLRSLVDLPFPQRAAIRREMVQNTMLTSTLPGAKPTNSNEPRAPPARLRPLDFPQYQVQGDIIAAHQYARGLTHLFSGLEKNVSAKHVEALNITLLGEVPLDRLIPEGYLPPKEWLQDPSTTPVSPSTPQTSSKLFNGTPMPSHKDFYSRAKEILYSNDSAFDALSGGPNMRPKAPSSNTIRLIYTHKFYQHLLLMAEYWDTTKDNYIPVPSSSNNNNNNNNEEEDSKSERYTGRRYGAGHEMPPEYRDDVIASFLEICVWPFRCNIQSPRYSVSRKLQLHKTRYIPIQGISSAICAQSTSREKARKGIVQGPLMGVHCRNVMGFRNEGEK